MKNNFSTNLKHLLVKTAKSQTDLANLLSVTPQTITKYLAGSIFPSIEKIILIADIFGYSIDDLIKKDLSAPDFELNEPTDEYQKVKNVDELTHAIKELTNEIRKQNQPT